MTEERPLERFTDRELVEELQTRCDALVIAMFRHDRQDSGATTMYAHGKAIVAEWLAGRLFKDLGRNDPEVTP